MTKKVAGALHIYEVPTDLAGVVLPEIESNTIYFALICITTLRLSIVNKLSRLYGFLL
jgi:hypothetical protein